MITIEQFKQITKHNALYSIMALPNIPSVLEHGILCYDYANKLPHKSVALESVQERREVKVTNSNRRLHSYANLYFDPHNPMLSRLRSLNDTICILAVNPLVLNLQNVIVTDRNAAVGIVRYIEPDKMEGNIDFDRVYAKYWHPDKGETDVNPFMIAENKAIKCAEVLVPECIPPEYIMGAVVINAGVKEKLEELGFTKKIIIDKNRFF